MGAVQSFAAPGLPQPPQLRTQEMAETSKMLEEYRQKCMREEASKLNYS